jgi:uncharacterized membrane protein
MADDVPLKWIALIVGMILAVPILAILFPILIVLIAEAPLVLVALAVLGVGFFGFVLTQYDVLPSSASADEDVDPVSTLQEEYAAGEISDAEFERRLDRIIESDQKAAESDDIDREQSVTDRDPSLERE